MDTNNQSESFIIESKKLSQYTGEELNNFFNQVTQYIKDQPFDQSTLDQVNGWLNKYKFKFIFEKFSYSLRYELIKLEYDNEIVEVKKDKLHYKAILYIRRIIRYLENISNNDNHYMAFSVDRLYKIKRELQEKQKNERQKQKHEKLNRRFNKLEL